MCGQVSFDNHLIQLAPGTVSTQYDTKEIWYKI